jgi:hypothetical protein
MLFTAQAVFGICYGPNEGAAGSENEYRLGIKGEVDLYAAQPSTGRAIVHPMQVVYNADNFVGWGTAIGVGIDNCPDYYGTNWQIYFDGANLGDYFCQQPYGSMSSTAQNQFFRIEWTTCPGDGQLKFVVYWNSAYKSCKTIGATFGRPSAGSESVGTTLTQTLDVQYSAIRAKSSAGTWGYFSSLHQCELDPPYEVNNVGVAQWRIQP